MKWTAWTICCEFFEIIPVINQKYPRGIFFTRENIIFLVKVTESKPRTRPNFLIFTPTCTTGGVEGSEAVTSTIRPNSKTSGHKKIESSVNIMSDKTEISSLLVEVWW
jgi:hypothetical protein